MHSLWTNTDEKQQETAPAPHSNCAGPILAHTVCEYFKSQVELHKLRCQFSPPWLMPWWCSKLPSPSMTICPTFLHQLIRQECSTTKTNISHTYIVWCSEFKGIYVYTFLPCENIRLQQKSQISGLLLKMDFPWHPPKSCWQRMITIKLPLIQKEIFTQIISLHNQSLMSDTPPNKVHD